MRDSVVAGPAVYFADVGSGGVNHHAGQAHDCIYIATDREYNASLEQLVCLGVALDLHGPTAAMSSLGFKEAAHGVAEVACFSVFKFHDTTEPVRVRAPRRRTDTATIRCSHGNTPCCSTTSSSSRSMQLSSF